MYLSDEAKIIIKLDMSLHCFYANSSHTCTVDKNMFPSEIYIIWYFLNINFYHERIAEFQTVLSLHVGADFEVLL